MRNSTSSILFLEFSHALGASIFMNLNVPLCHFLVPMVYHPVLR
jgi:hypothetical protein